MKHFSSHTERVTGKFNNRDVLCRTGPAQMSACVVRAVVLGKPIEYVKHVIMCKVRSIRFQPMANTK